MIAYERITDRLREHDSKVVQTRPGQATAQCPAHEDHTPSLSIRGTETRAILHCFAGCADEDVLTALGLGVRDLYDQPRTSYEYTDRTVFRSYGADGKRQFRQQVKSGATGSSLYRLEAVQQAVRAGGTVWLAEGEEDVHTLESEGVTATTAPQGASNFGSVDTSPLAGATVIAVPDRDQAGKRWAADVAGKLAQVAGSVQFRLPADGKDVSDHLAAGRGLDELQHVDPPDAPGDTGERLEPSSWADVDLTGLLDGTYRPIEPTLMPRGDGTCLVYPGLTHSFHGESESGKSLLAQMETVRLVNAGEHVLYLDHEADPDATVARLQMLGGQPDRIVECFHYKQPEAHPGTGGAEQADWQAMLARTYTLAVVDGVTDSLGLFGFGTQDNDDIARWARVLPRRIAADTGAAVIVIDHVTKDKESRGRFAIGGQAKIAGLTGAAYTVETTKPLGRGLAGEIVLRVGKDRPGHVRGHSGDMRGHDRTQETARVIVDSTVNPDRPTVTVTGPHSSDGASDRFRPTALMERISRHIEAAGEPVSWTAMRADVSGKTEAKRQALDVLVTEGYLSREAGSRNANLHRSVTPYRQADDPESDRHIGGDGSDSQNPSQTTVTRPRHKDGGREDGSLSRPGDGSGTGEGREDGSGREQAESEVSTPHCQDCGDPIAFGSHCAGCMRASHGVTAAPNEGEATL